MSKMNWNRLIFFGVGTFFGSAFLGLVGSLFGRKG